MCFSATADLVIGGGTVAAGVDAIRHVRRPAQRWVALLPIVLGAHQMTESLVWLGLDGSVDEAVWRPAMWVYLAIAFGLVPVMVPLAVGALEPVVRRRRIGAFTVLGVSVATVLMYAVVRGPVDAAIEGHHIAYTVDLWQGSLLVFLYVLATCGSLLASSDQAVRWFGGVNLVAVVGLAWLDRTAFVSLWCAWAAVASVSIALWLRAGAGDGRHDRQPSTSGAPRPRPAADASLHRADSRPGRLHGWGIASRSSSTAARSTRPSCVRRQNPSSPTVTSASASTTWRSPPTP
jgi:hypothetical protein